MSKDVRELIEEIEALSDDGEVWALDAGVADYNLGTVVSLKSLVAQRDELLAAAKRVADGDDMISMITPDIESNYRQLRQAIAKAGSGE